eukprot:931311-Pelagomonas_calceolata.AAC.1
MDASTSQKRGGMAHTFELFVLKHKIPENGYPCPQPYMEPQDKAFCLIHAFNMAMGTPVLSGASVLSHIMMLQNTLALRNLAHISLRHLYTPDIGNFNTIVNHHLHYLPWNATHNYYLHYSRTDLQRGQINQNLVECLSNSSAWASAIIVTSNHGYC